MSASPMPRAEVDIDLDLVSRLVATQFPDLASLVLVPIASGWDNEIYRLGDDLAVRLPRRAASAELVAHELRWLPDLAPRLPLAVPTPVRAGRPDLGYPWAWSVCRWVEGRTVADAPPADQSRLAVDLGAFVGALRRPAPVDAPRNPYRGVPLAERDTAVRQRIDQLRDVVDPDAATNRWEEAVAASPWHGPPMWIHGDLHPLNVVVADGRTSGVIDFGDVAAGDPATDLSAAWIFLEPAERPLFRDAAGVDPTDADLWSRARGWALSHGLACLGSSADNPRIASIGRRTIDAVLTDPA